MPTQIRRLKEHEVTAETTHMEEFLLMEEELTNDQDAVVNNIRDITRRFCLSTVVYCVAITSDYFRLPDINRIT